MHPSSTRFAIAPLSTPAYDLRPAQVQSVCGSQLRLRAWCRQIRPDGVPGVGVQGCGRNHRVRHSHLRRAGGLAHAPHVSGGRQTAGGRPACVLDWAHGSLVCAGVLAASTLCSSSSHTTHDTWLCTDAKHTVFHSKLATTQWNGRCEVTIN